MSSDNLIHVQFPNHFASSLPTEDDMRASCFAPSREPVRSVPKPRKERERCGGLMFFPRLKVWRDHSGNVTIDPATLEGRSYGWWSMLRRINGKVVFNSYRYSVTTSKHQRCARRWLSEQGIAVDLVIEAPKGLQNLERAIDHHSTLIRNLEAAHDNPRANKRKNEERRQAINIHKGKIAAIKRLTKAVAGE